MFYGWIILIVCFINVCGEGAMKYLFPVVLLPLIGTFGWSRAATAGIFSVGGLMNGFGSPLLGILLDRIGPRKFFPLGGLLLFLGLLAASRIDQYWQLVLIYTCLLAVGENIISSYTNVAVIGRWFHRQRGRAIGIADTGTALGAAVFVPLAQWLIIRMGWRHTLLVFAFIFLIMLVPLNLILMRARPEDKGQFPDGISDSQSPPMGKPVSISSQNPGRQEMTFRQVLATPSLYFLTSARLFGTAAAYMVTIHIIAFFIDAGYSEMVAASTLAFSQMVSFAGRPLFGIISDRIGREKMMTASYVLDITGMVLILGFGDGRALWPISLFALFHGLSSGPVGIAVGAKAADLYPGFILGRVMGVVNLGRGLGLALGPFLGGLFYDRTKNYILAFSLAIGFMLLSLACFWMAHFMGKASPSVRKE